MNAFWASSRSRANPSTRGCERVGSAPMTSRTKAPLLALTAGDPAGIGPEIVLAALRDEAVARNARLVVLGPGSLRPSAVRLFELDADVSAIERSAWIDTGE